MDVLGKPSKNAATNLKRLMEERGLDMIALAKASGVKYQTIYALLEKQRHRPSFDLVCSLADALDVSVDQLRETPSRSNKRKIPA